MVRVYYFLSDGSKESVDTKQSGGVNGVVVGLLVLFGLLVAGAIVVALLRKFKVKSRHRADRSRLVPLAKQSIELLYNIVYDFCGHNCVEFRKYSI